MENIFTELEQWMGISQDDAYLYLRKDQDDYTLQVILRAVQSCFLPDSEDIVTFNGDPQNFFKELTPQDVEPALQRIKANNPYFYEMAFMD